MNNVSKKRTIIDITISLLIAILIECAFMYLRAINLVLSGIVFFILYSVIIVIIGSRNKKKAVLYAAVFATVNITINIILRSLWWSETLISLPEEIMHLLGIICGVALLKCRKIARIAIVLIMVAFCLVFNRIYIHWLQYLSHSNLTGVVLEQVDNIMAMPQQEIVRDKGRFSMFVHWGLYSVYGGVYRGKNVEWGYSEQIQSFAGIFSDWYARAAEQFSAKQWNADSIAVLAKRAGMDAIVFTSKHHDGFCMYNSKETDFTIMNTPFGRDALMELSEACKRQGLNLGIYFSLIDWHYPPAYPISSHNADPITPEHHEYNKRQVKELLENYGAVSELWFDMGSLTREQSCELYCLVKSIQPNCKVSGRIGNDYGDFAVMPDNVIPDFLPNKPWQTAESVYKETWGYRSWQKHIPMNEKLVEKIESLQRVIGAGGNYLLNIGPTGDGAVTDYEKMLLLSIGKWIDSSGWLATARASLYKDNDNVRREFLRGRYAKHGKEIASVVDKKWNKVYGLKDADTLYHYSMFDYYRTKKAVCGYRWYFPYSTGSSKIRIIVPDIENNFEAVYKNGETVRLTHKKEIDSADCIYTLLPKSLDSKQIEISTVERIPVKAPAQISKEYNFLSKEQGIASFAVGTADAIEVWHNGKLIAERMYTNIQPKPLVFAVPVVKGENNLTIKLFSRFDSCIDYSLLPVATRYFEIW